MNNDRFLTVSGVSEGLYTEKRSRFIAYAVPVSSAAEAKERVDAYRKRYFDARHVCWAYRLGAGEGTFRVSDDGEPSGTAGKPILGQLLSAGLTDVLVVVVRYFGGIKLGTGGLIVAYRAAAAEAIGAAIIIEKTIDEEFTVAFEYPFLDRVMRLVKEEGPAIVSQIFELDCEMTLRIRRRDAGRLRERLLQIESVYLK